jgi:hypothetical protein
VYILVIKLLVVITMERGACISFKCERVCVGACKSFSVQVYQDSRDIYVKRCHTISYFALGSNHIHAIINHGDKHSFQSYINHKILINHYYHAYSFVKRDNGLSRSMHHFIYHMDKHNPERVKIY